MRVRDNKLKITFYKIITTTFSKLSNTDVIRYILVSPLFVIEILHRAVDVFEDYFSECNESSLKENFVVVYEVW